MIKEQNSSAVVAEALSPIPTNPTDNEPATATAPVPVPEIVEKPVASENVVVDTVVPKKEPSPVKEDLMVVEEPKKFEPEADADMTEVVTVEEKLELKAEKSKPKPMNGDVTKVSDA